MNKQQLLKLATDRYNKSNKWSVFTPHMMEGVLSAVVDTMIDGLISDGKITVRGLASLEVVDYGNKRRGAWNPFKHEPMNYIPQKKIRCRFSKKVREAINKVEVNNSTDDELKEI